jgi:glycopeptide antibiotics resistance protein
VVQLSGELWQAELEVHGGGYIAKTMIAILDLYRSYGYLLNIVVVGFLLVLGVLYATFRATRPRTSELIRTGSQTIGLLLLLFLTLSPMKYEPVPGFRSLQVSAIISHLSSATPAGSPWPDWHDPLGNIMMTVPLAFGLALTWNYRRVLATIALLSTTIEITQHFFIRGRTSQLSDVVLNTLGGAFGVGLVALSAIVTRKLSSRRSTLSKSSDATTGVPPG